jgi:hypothetical protein
LAVSVEARYQAARARSIIAVAATTALAGIGLAATGQSSLGAVVTLPSLIGLIYGLHRFGRSGPDD